VGTARSQDRPVEIQDEHYYLDTLGFLGMADYYQRVDRRDPLVYVGEYAVANGAGNGNFSAALAEAAFLTGLEANGDHVVMASYAPLLAHPAWKAWTPNAIVFDQGRCYGTPSYYLQTMFAATAATWFAQATSISRKFRSSHPKAGSALVRGRHPGRIQEHFIHGRGWKTGLQERLLTGDEGLEAVQGAVDGRGRVLRQTGKEDAFELAQIADSLWGDGVFEVQARKLGGFDGFQIQFQAEEDGQQRVWNIGGWGKRPHRTARNLR